MSRSPMVAQDPTLVRILVAHYAIGVCPGGSAGALEWDSGGTMVR